MTTPPPPLALPSFLAGHQVRVVDALERVLPGDAVEPLLVHRAMRYTALAPSKRVRAVLAFLAAELCGHDDRAGGVAAAVELIHASSLILDDLPSMDNAPVRRGRPACHVEFGETTALLAAFGLLTLSFEVMAREYEPALASRLVALFADAVGSEGLIGGQADDLLATDRAITFERLERIHRLKTGVLFSAAATGGALTAGASSAQLAAVAAYAKNLGLAFQVIDDLLDVEGDPAQTGKLVRQDLKKTTFVSFSGVEGARQLAGELCDTADRALAPFGARAARLRELSRFVASRSA
jgi:geranylgeranyl pyrophosphate synthase